MGTYADWLFEQQIDDVFCEEPTPPDLYDFGDWDDYSEINYEMAMAQTAREEYICEAKRKAVKFKENRTMIDGFSGTYYTKAVGVTFGNRQEVIKKLKRGDELKFIPEPTNAYDRNAIMITTESGEQIGYISKQYNKETLDRMRSGVVYYPVVSEVTGGVGYAYGVNIRVKYVFEGAKTPRAIKEDNGVHEEKASEKAYSNYNQSLEEKTEEKTNLEEAPTQFVAPIQELELTQEIKPIKEENMTNKKCIAGFVLGVLSAFFYWILPILLPMSAIITSSVGLAEIDKTEEKGKGLGVWGLVLGIIYTIQSIIKLTINGSI